MKRGLKKSGQAGFTLIELTISLIVIVEVLLGVLMLFDFTNKLSHAQTNIADMQSTLRVAESEMEAMIRMAGRGDLKFSNLSPGKAIWVRNNVPLNARIGDATSPQIVAGTDVLTLRGVFTAPIYQVNAMDTTTIQYLDNSNNPTSPALAVKGTLRIREKSPTNLTQDLQPLIDLKAANIPAALVLVSASKPDVNGVVELDPTTIAVATVLVNAQSVRQVTFSFKVRSAVPTDRVSLYNKLGTDGTFPATLTSVGAVGLLEEHRFYIRQSYAIANNAASDPTPKLTRARFMPGTDVAYGLPPTGDPSNLLIDVADNVLDLQVALGMDTINHLPVTALTNPVSSVVRIATNRVDGIIAETANGQNDDWLYNSTTDNVADTYVLPPIPPSVTPLPPVPLWLDVPVYFVRVNLIARTDRRDPKYEAPALSQIEDRIYSTIDPLNVANATAGSPHLRQFRRRVLQTVIDVRNNV